MKPLVDADVLVYEVGFGAETAAKGEANDSDALPSWRMVSDFLHARIDDICERVGATEPYQLYLTKGTTNFRDAIATVQPYKGNRQGNKPWHYDNLRLYMTDILGAKMVDGIEADDQMTIDHVHSDGATIICSRDKDLRQVPGWHYTWELGRQPSFGPIDISHDGSIELSPDRKKIIGTGMAFFLAQCLWGDRADYIPGIPKMGPVGAYDVLKGCTTIKAMYNAVVQEYKNAYGMKEWEERLLEQGRLLFMTRELHEDDSPVLWELEMGVT